MAACCDGIEDISFENDVINIYPNPSNRIFNVELKNMNESLRIEIYNSTGQLMDIKNINTNYSVLNFSDKAKGIYFIKCISANSKHTLKIIRE